jgi:hypothetical protein
MTHTTTRQEIHHQVPRVSSLRDSSGKPLLRWIYLCWTMLSLVAEEQIHWVVGTIFLEKRASFD